MSRYFELIAPRSYIQTDHSAKNLLELVDHSAPDFISGHYYVAPWIHRLPASWETMIVFRNPIRHLLSNYWHVRDHERIALDHEMNDLIDAAKMHKFESLLDHGTVKNFSVLFDNPQTRFLLGKESGAITDDEFAEAVSLLSDITHVGISERIDLFASQVASCMPWAKNWEQQAVPRVMANAHNNIAPENLSRGLLEKICLQTQYDDQLYREAERRQMAKPQPKLQLKGRDLDGQTANLIAVHDLARILSPIIHGARSGFEFMLDVDEILIHPPNLDSGWARLTIPGIELTGQSRLEGVLRLANAAAPPVQFGIEMRAQGEVLVSASFIVTTGHPCGVSLMFPDHFGPVELRLQTQMTDDRPNFCAWARFSRFAFR